MKKINNYLDNFEAIKQKNNLIEQSRIRRLTNEEKNDLDELIDLIDEFEYRLINFD